jgi:hypothetical protein
MTEIDTMNMHLPHTENLLTFQKGIEGLVFLPVGRKIPSGVQQPEKSVLGPDNSS